MPEDICDSTWLASFYFQLFTLTSYDSLPPFVFRFGQFLHSVYHWFSYPNICGIYGLILLLVKTLARAWISKYIGYIYIDILHIYRYSFFYVHVLILYTELKVVWGMEILTQINKHSINKYLPRKVMFAKCNTWWIIISYTITAFRENANRPPAGVSDNPCVIMSYLIHCGLVMSYGDIDQG